MMYQVFYLGLSVYGPDVKHCILEPKLDMELNSAGTFTFIVPVENKTLWDSIEVFNGEVVIYEGDDIIWFGRPFQIVRNWKNQKVVTCEGALSYFNDTVQATHTYDNWNLYLDDQHTQKGFFNRIVELHNDMVRMDGNSSREILVGNISVDNEPNIYREVDYETTAEILQQMCLDTNGGYFMIRKENGNNYIDWVKDMPYATTQKITFGKNLLDVNQDLNGSDICTVLLAFGKDDKTVAGLNQWTTEDDAYDFEDGNGVYHNTKNGEYLIHREGYKKYGRVLKVKTWNDMVANDTEGKRQLFQKAAEWLNDQNTEVLTIECDAADLHYIDADENGKLRIGQKVTVLSPIHDLNGKELSIFKVSMSLDSGAKHITMGTPPKRELTDIVKNSGGSTRGSSGTTGGGGGSDGSSGSGSVSIPVKDVQVKYPGDEKFRTVVKKKVAKIDLSEIASGVSDVRIDGTSIVNDHVANIDSSQFGTDVEANPEGTAVDNLTSILIGEDKYNIPTAPVVDVTLDGESIVDPNDGVAKILSQDIIEEIGGNFERVVEKDDDPPTINLGKDTDLFIETDNPDDETIILSSSSDIPINLQEMGGWDKYVQDFVAQPTQYYDESSHTYKYDPTSPTRVHHEITCNGAGSTTWWFAEVPSAAPLPFTNHEGTLTVYGHKIKTAGYVDITFEKHDQNIKYRPTKVTGVFSFKIMHAGEEGAYMPVQDEYCCSDIIRIHVSNDGENWTTYEPVSGPQDGNGTFIFDIDGYYSYVRMSCTNNVYNPAGYQNFAVYAVPESVIEDIWYKTANKTWIKMPHVKDVQIDGVSIVSDKVANIDSSQFGTPVEANPTGESVGNLTSILIGENKYDIPSGGGGTGNHLDGITAPTALIGNDGDEYFELSGNLPGSHIVSLKFKVTERKGTGDGMIQYSKLGFYDSNDNKFSWPSDTTWSDDVGHYENDPINDNAKMLLVSIPCTATIDLPSGSYIDSSVYTRFGWYTANDSADRDPVGWELYISEDGVNYTLIDTRTNQTITDSREVLAFKDTYVSSALPTIKDIYFKKSGTWLKDDFSSGGGGSSVVPNPSGSPSSRLIKIGIDGVVYEVSAGTGGAESVEFDYTGDIQTFVAPKTSTYKLEVWGAQGGSGGAGVHGGYGGYSVGMINLNQGDTLYVCVGGKGGGSDTSDTDVVGYNGGGEANYGGSRGNGGGATHIALITGTLNTLSIVPSNVVIVAGGGGGAGFYGAGDEGDGGSGGGYIGGHGLFNGSTTGDSYSYTGSGGTQSAGGATVNYPDTQPDGLFGKGADRYDDSYWGGSGGGGGFYGGGASTNNAGAGGGSGYINTTLLTDACMYGYGVSESADTATKTVSVNLYSSDPEEMKAKVGNGYARISWTEEFDPYVTVGDLYNACVANNVTPASHSLNDIIAEFLRVN